MFKNVKTQQEAFSVLVSQGSVGLEMIVQVSLWEIKTVLGEATLPFSFLPPFLVENNSPEESYFEQELIFSGILFRALDKNEYLVMIRDNFL